ncbi:MAG TPA: hypothetical protein VNV44_05140 [Solirubrobacteraceae bacterium]|nr:hypothetical protein [Solirubrobacteraceae bacterium]
MATNNSTPRPGPRRRSLLWAAALVAAGGLATALARGGAPAEATPAQPPSYAALAAGGEGASGLTIVDGSAPRATPGNAGPTWPAVPPEGSGGSWPLTSSIRRLKLAVPGLSAWIARSAAGGVCVLLYDGKPVEGVNAVDLACSTPAGFGAGASLEVSEIPGMPGRVIEAGVEPDGVSAVSTPLADGTTAVSPVSGNAWARSGTEPPAPGAEPTAITGGWR